MKQYGFVYDNLEEMKSFIYSKNIDKNDNILVQVFTGVIDANYIKKVISEILSVLPQAEIIGATTSGEIFKKRTMDYSTVIAITVFEKTKIKSKLLNISNNEYESGVNIVKELVEEDTKVLILFSEGISINSLDILKGIQSANSNIIVCGGKAGDNGNIKGTIVFTKRGISKNGIAAVSLTGNQLNVTTGCSFGWSTIGKLMTITKASKNRIYTIDNVKVADIYRKYLGDEVAEGLPMSANEFPLITIKDGIGTPNVPYACNDDGSLSFFGNVEVNDKVKFGYGNVNMLIDKSSKICRKFKEENVEAIFIYSCTARKYFMHEKNYLNINPLSRIAPAFGFFTYGEFFTDNNSNRLFNMAMTVLGMSEGRNDLHFSGIPAKMFPERKDIGAIKAFTKLVDESTKELQETNKILEEQKRKIEKMNNITKSILQINSEMISSGEFDIFIKALLDKILDVIVKGKMGSILLVENNRLYYKAVKGYIIDKIKDRTYEMKDVYQYNEQFKPVILSSEQCDYWNNLLEQQPKQILTCCIGIDGQIAGIINIFNTNNEEDFNEEDKSLLKYICYDTAVALKNFRLLKDMLHMSRYDYLTGAYNRSYFRKVLNETLNKSKIQKTNFIICGMDMNDFKIINDTCGHDRGDKLLAKFAEIFIKGIGEDGVLGRVGGDEFTAIFADKSKEQVTQIINRVYSMIAEEAMTNISFAYGLSEFPDDSDNIEELLKIADRRMYINKRTMKNKK